MVKPAQQFINRTWNPTPGEGAGVIVDPSLPSRRRRAATLTR
ncbi:hypothetical protein [Streptomyces sp. NPDC055099]